MNSVNSKLDKNNKKFNIIGGVIQRVEEKCNQNGMRIEVIEEENAGLKLRFEQLEQYKYIAQIVYYTVREKVGILLTCEILQTVQYAIFLYELWKSLETVEKVAVFHTCTEMTS